MPDDPALLTAAWFDAWRAKDADAIAHMMDAPYVYVAPNGAVDDHRCVMIWHRQRPEVQGPRSAEFYLKRSAYTSGWSDSHGR